MRREIDRLKLINKQQADSISRLESEVTAKNQELMKQGEERKKFDDLLRFEKEKFSNLEIDIRKTKMEYEILEKDKNSEITRLTRQLDQKDAMY